MTTLQAILLAKASGDRDAVNEASLGRVYQHVQKVAKGERSFAIITSWRAGNTKKQNLASFKKLQSEVRSLGSGFFRLQGNWQECQLSDVPYNKCPPDQLVDSSEPAIFAVGVKKKDAVRLMGKYDQDAIVYAGPETGGKVHLLLRGGGQEVIGGFSPNKIAQAYSRVRGKSFTFEYVTQSWSEALVERSLRDKIAALRKQYPG